MKISTLALAILCAVPAVALAQQGPMSGGPHGMMSGSSMNHMMQMHQAARKQVLAALTPAHKQLLATLVGQLAIADAPNVKAAAAQLDAALGASEKQAILAAHSQMAAQMKAQRAQMMQAWQSAHPDASPHPMMMNHWQGDMHDKMPTDPGMILLMLAGHGGPARR